MSRIVAGSDFIRKSRDAVAFRGAWIFRNGRLSNAAVLNMVTQPIGVGAVIRAVKVMANPAAPIGAASLNYRIGLTIRPTVTDFDAEIVDELMPSRFDDSRDALLGMSDDVSEAYEVTIPISGVPKRVVFNAATDQGAAFLFQAGVLVEHLTGV